MANKTFIVTYKLTELAASHTWHSTTVEAPSLGRAADLAWKVIKQKPTVKGKRITKGSVDIQEVKAGKE